MTPDRWIDLPRRPRSNQSVLDRILAADSGRMQHLEFAEKVRQHLL